MAKHAQHTVKSTVRNWLEDCASDVEELTEEMTTWRDNLEEKFSQTSKYEEISEAADTLEYTDMRSKVEALIEAIDALDDEWAKQKTALDQEVDVRQYKPGRLPRWARLSNATSGADVALSQLEEIEQWPDGNIPSYIQDVRDALQECEAVSFPGMY